jgi:hypothetical protein
MFDVGLPFFAVIGLIVVGMAIAIGGPLIQGVESVASPLPSIAWFWPMALVIIVVIGVVIRFRQQTSYYGGG